MRILICGDRDWDNRWAIKRRVLNLMAKHDLKPSDLVIIEGGAMGADRQAREVAESLGIAVMEFPANWNFYHKPAGPIRNAWMLRWGMPDEVWAFHPYIENSKGTKNMVEQAKKGKIETHVYTD